MNGFLVGFEKRGGVELSFVGYRADKKKVDDVYNRLDSSNKKTREKAWDDLDEIQAYDDIRVGSKALARIIMTESDREVFDRRDDGSAYGSKRTPAMSRQEAKALFKKSLPAVKAKIPRAIERAWEMELSRKPIPGLPAMTRKDIEQSYGRWVDKYKEDGEKLLNDKGYKSFKLEWH